MNKLINIVSLGLGIVFLTGCENRSMFDLEQFVAAEKAKPATPIEPLPVPKPHPVYTYTASDLLDPFDVTNVISNKKEEYEDPRDLNRVREDLEEYPLDGIRVVGTMVVKGVPWAVVNAPDGTIHRVKTGRYMGEDDGRIVSVDIDEQKVTLVEDVQSATGEWVQREVFLSVNDE